MSQENVDLIRRMNAAFNAGEYDVMAEHFDSAAEFVDHMPLPDVASSVRGRDELRTVLEAWSEGFRGFEGNVVEYVERGDFVVCVTNWRFVSRDEGIEMQWSGAEAWQVRDGKVVWGQAGFRDKDAALEAVGLRE
jgi:ketosteroid isomerase-like protein